MNCLNCGSPLGGQDWLCYSCQSDGVKLDDIIEVNESVRDRVEKYFIIAAVRCSNCGDLHGTVSSNGEKYTAESFGIDSISDWEKRMREEEDWLRSNQEQVLFALADLRDEWPESVSATKTHIL